MPSFALERHKIEPDCTGYTWGESIKALIKIIAGFPLIKYSLYEPNASQNCHC